MFISDDGNGTNNGPVPIIVHINKKKSVQWLIFIKYYNNSYFVDIHKNTTKWVFTC